MAKKSSVENNKKRERMCKSFSSAKQSLKERFMDRTISVQERFALAVKMSEKPRNSSRVRVRNRCALTGRPRGCYRLFGLSRNAFRLLALRGEIPGVVKDSW